MNYIDLKERNVKLKSYSPLNLEYTNTTRRELLWEIDENKFVKVGHIEVSVTETKTEHFQERFKEFLDEACKLYNKIVMGNKNIEVEYEEIKG